LGDCHSGCAPIGRLDGVTVCLRRGLRCGLLAHARTVPDSSTLNRDHTGPSSKTHTRARNCMLPVPALRCAHPCKVWPPVVVVKATSREPGGMYWLATMM